MKSLRMIFNLTDEQRERLERLRVSWGLRSHAEVLRTLIDLDREGPMPDAERKRIMLDLHEREVATRAAAPKGAATAKASPKPKKVAAPARTHRGWDTNGEPIY